MNALDAVAEALRRAGEPLHYVEVTRQMLDTGLWQTAGKTPEATINARIAVDIKQHPETTRFQRAAPGVFALREWGLAEHAPAQPAPVAPPASEVPPKMSFSNAAEAVLEQYGDRQPMHYREITRKMLDLALIDTEGQTPEATLYAQILTEIKRQTRRGETPRFVKHGKGFFGLQKWMGEGLAFQIGRHNADVQRRLLRRLRGMPPAEFESLVAQLLVALGFEDVSVTRHSGDGGIDVRGAMVVGDVIRTRMAVQVKRWKQNVQSPVVQQVRGSLGAHEQGLIITTSDYSAGAWKEAERGDTVPVALMNGEQLARLMIENDIGIQRTSHDLIELVEGLDP